MAHAPPALGQGWHEPRDESTGPGRRPKRVCPSPGEVSLSFFFCAVKKKKEAATDFDGGRFGSGVWQTGLGKSRRSWVFLWYPVSYARRLPPSERFSHGFSWHPRCPQRLGAGRTVRQAGAATSSSTPRGWSEPGHEKQVSQ